MSWTKKHDEFCLKQKLRPSTCVVLRDILRKANSHSVCEIEIDLRVINQWVKKIRGKGYDRKTLKAALAQLDGCTDGLVLIGKTYTWAVHKVVVRPLSFILAQKSQDTGKTPKLSTGNPMYSDEHKKRSTEQQQQNISKLGNILRKVGLNYSQHAINRLWRLSGKSFESIKESIELLLLSHSTQVEKIKNPQGWLVNCLKYGWAKGFNLYYQTDLPFFKTGDEISCFVGDAMGKPTHQT